jgi:AraC-like DNA-binding protein
MEAHQTPGELTTACFGRVDGLDATTAAYEVGYESVSQFSREYSRCFGQPPIRDIKGLKANGTTEVEAV